MADVSDGMSVEVARPCHRSRMAVETDDGPAPLREPSYGRRLAGRCRGDRHRRRNRLGVQPICCADDQSLRLVGIQLQTVLHVLLPYISGAGSKTLGSVVGVYGQTELRVISMLVILDAVLRDDITHWAAVDSKQQRAKYRSLRNADVEEQCWTDVVPS